MPDDEEDVDIDMFYQKKPEEMTKTTEKFFSDENNVDYNKMDQKLVALKHSETVAGAMLFQTNNLEKPQQRVESIVEEEDLFSDK